MGSLDDPSSCFVSRLALLVGALFFALLDVRAIVPRGHTLLGRFALVARVAAQMLRLPFARLRPLADHRVQRLVQQFHVMRVGSADDDRQRDSTRVDQQAALAPIFFPGPWDWLPRTVLPAGPCPSRRRSTASARRCLPSRRTRPGPSARALRRSLPCASAENARGWSCPRQTRPVPPSTDSRSATHRRWLRISAELASVYDQRLVYVDTFDLRGDDAREPEAQSCSTMRPIRSKT